MRDAGIVHEDVEPAEARKHRFDQERGRAGRCHL